MTNDLTRYYEDRHAMFASRGWKDLVDDVREMLKASDRLTGATPENLGFKQGEISLMNWFLTLEEHSKQAYADLQLPLPSGASDGTDDEVRDTHDES